METSSLLFITILHTLACRYGMSCSLEELTSLSPVINVSKKFTNNMGSEMENQSKVLEALIVLNENGYIFLNSINDKSTITIKGLIKVDNKVLCN